MRLVELEEKASMLPLVVGTMAMLEVMAPSSGIQGGDIGLGCSLRPQGQVVQRARRHDGGVQDIGLRG